MNVTATTYQAALDGLSRTIIAEAAPVVDRTGAFPTTSIQALRSAGLLGAVSSPGVGGLGLGVRGAAQIVRRVAEECGSTAMVLTMH